MGEASEATLESVASELNWPSTNKLSQALHRRGVRVSTSRLQDFMRKQSHRQLFAPDNRRAAPGKRSSGPKEDAIRSGVVALKPGERWDADLISYVSFPGTGRDGKVYRYILIAQDVYTREIYTEALETNSREAVAGAFEVMLQKHGTPDSVHTDQGEFEGEAFARVCNNVYIVHMKQEKGDYDHTSTLSKAIAELRRALSLQVAATGRQDWGELLEKVTEGLNKMPRDPLLGASADSVAKREDPDIDFSLKQIAAEKVEAVAEQVEKTGGKLEKEGAFRVKDLTDGPVRRGYKPRWSSEVHKVDQVTGSLVKDTEGKTFQTRLVLPVPATSAEVGVPEYLRRGSAQIDAVRRAKLASIHEPLTRWLVRQPNHKAQLSQAGTYLRSIGKSWSGIQAIVAARLLGFETSQEGPITFIRATQADVERYS